MAGCRDGKRGTKEEVERARKRRKGVKRNARDGGSGAGRRGGAGRIGSIKEGTGRERREKGHQVDS